MDIQQPHMPVDPEFTRALDRHGRLPRGASRATALLAAFLASDFHSTATGTLPNDVKVLSKGILSGRHFLQVDEIVNIGAALKGRFEEKGKGRTLKLHLTDGKQQVIGFEYRYIEALSVNSTPGMKILVTDVFVHRGILFLCPENVEVLGGSVPRLIRAFEAAKTALSRTTVKGRETMQIDQMYSEAELVAWEFECLPTPSVSNPVNADAVPVTSNRPAMPPTRQPPVTSFAGERADGVHRHVQIRSPIINAAQTGQSVATTQETHGGQCLTPRPVCQPKKGVKQPGIPPKAPSPSFLKNLALPVKRSAKLEVVNLLGSECVTPIRVPKPSMPSPSSLISERPSKHEFDVIDLLDDE